MTTDDGRSGAAAPSGYSAEPEPCSTVSAVPASVPNAAELRAAFMAGWPTGHHGNCPEDSWAAYVSALEGARK
jgi:hypothetical protein